MTDCCAKKNLAWRPLLAVVYLIINFRVEAGAATVFERALDGLAAGLTLLALIYVGARLFQLIDAADGDDPLACCSGKSK